MASGKSYDVSELEVGDNTTVHGHILELSPIKTSENKPEQFDVLVIDFQLFVYHTFSELLIFPPCSQESTLIVRSLSV